MRNIKIGDEVMVFTPYGRTPLMDAWARDLKLTNTDFSVNLHKEWTDLRYVFIDKGGKTVLFQLEPEITLNTTKGKIKVAHLSKEDEVEIFESSDGKEVFRDRNGKDELRSRFCKVRGITDRQGSYYFEIRGTDIKPVTIYKEGVYLQIH